MRKILLGLVIMIIISCSAVSYTPPAPLNPSLPYEPATILQDGTYQVNQIYESSKECDVFLADGTRYRTTYDAWIKETEVCILVVNNDYAVLHGCQSPLSL